MLQGVHLVVAIFCRLAAVHDVLGRLVSELLQRLAFPLVEVVVLDLLLMEDATDALRSAVS